MPLLGNGYDCSKLTRDQYLQFKHAFVEKCMYNNLFVQNKDQRVMQAILNVLCMIICKRIPDGVVNFPVDGLARKVKLVPLPKGLGYEPLPSGMVKKDSKPLDPTQPMQKQGSVKDQNMGSSLLDLFKKNPDEFKLNTNEQCVVRVRIQTKKMTQSEIAEEDRRIAKHNAKDQSSFSAGKSYVSDTQSIEHPNLVTVELGGERFIEQDDDDRALAISARPKELSYSAFVLHENAQRVHRQDFVEQIVRHCVEFFDGHPERMDQIVQIAEKEAKRVEEEFIKNTCSEYEMPLFDIPIYAPDYDN